MCIVIHIWNKDHIQKSLIYIVKISDSLFLVSPITTFLVLYFCYPFLIAKKKKQIHISSLLLHKRITIYHILDLIYCTAQISWRLLHISVYRSFANCFIACYALLSFLLIDTCHINNISVKNIIHKSFYIFDYTSKFIF